MQLALKSQVYCVLRDCCCCRENHIHYIFVDHILLKSTVQLSSVPQLCPTLCDPVDCSTPGFPVHHFQSLLKLMSIKSVMPSNHVILCSPLLLPPSIFTNIRVFRISQFFVSGGQSIGVSASASVLPVNVSKCKNT